MVAIRPFCALRYSTAGIQAGAQNGGVPDLSHLISPPYDVIDPQQQEQLYQRSPYNIVRLILGRQQADDTAADNRYTRAQRDFRTWRDQGILRQDAAAALYVIEHTFDDEARQRCRLGFLGLLELHDEIQRHVFRHEATLSAPKEDRTKLLAAVPANLEPIFCLYPDEDKKVHATLGRICASTPPSVEARLHGDTIRCWAVTKPEILTEMTRRLAAVSLLIADGHHRFEVACAHRRQYPTLMSYFVSMEDPALLVRPIHRLIASSVRIDLSALRALCRVEPLANLQALSEWPADQRQGCFGYYDGAASYRVSLHPEALARWLLTPAVPQPLAALDVSILHGLILPTLGIGHDAVRYTGQTAEAVAQVERRQAAGVWLLRGIPLRQVYALASQGFTLPPKSTYFYPKVPSGLAIHAFDR